MKKWFVWVVVLIIACSCGTTKAVDVVRDRVDTVYVAKHHIDSVYVSDRERVYVVRDTVFVERVREQYKYKVKVDTVYQHQLDSVVVVREVPVEVAKPYVPGYVKWLAYMGVIAIVLAVVWLLRKLRVI